MAILEKTQYYLPKLEQTGLPIFYASVGQVTRVIALEDLPFRHLHFNTINIMEFLNIKAAFIVFFYCSSENATKFPTLWPATLAWTH